VVLEHSWKLAVDVPAPELALSPKAVEVQQSPVGSALAPGIP